MALNIKYNDLYILLIGWENLTFWTGPIVVDSMIVLIVDRSCVVPVVRVFRTENKILENVVFWTAIGSKMIVMMKKHH